MQIKDTKWYLEGGGKEEWRERAAQLADQLLRMVNTAACVWADYKGSEQSAGTGSLAFLQAETNRASEILQRLSDELKDSAVQSSPPPYE